MQSVLGVQIVQQQIVNFAIKQVILHWVVIQHSQQYRMILNH